MTPKTTEALQHLQNNPDFREFVGHLDTEFQTATQMLYNAEGDGVLVLQGRCQTYQHILKGIQNVQKQSATRS